MHAESSSLDCGGVDAALAVRGAGSAAISLEDKVCLSFIHEEHLQAVEGRTDGSTVARNISSNKAEQVKQYILRRIPMRKLGTPQDIVYVHLYLASDEAAYVM